MRTQQSPPVDVTLRPTVVSLVEACAKAEAAIEEHTAAMIDAALEARNAGIDTGAQVDFENTKRNVIGCIRRTAWHSIMDISGMRNILSVRRQDAFDASIHPTDRNKETPMPTLAAVNDILLNCDHAALVTEMFEEAYNFLMPGRSQSNRHVTNKKNARYALGEKVVLTGIYRSSRLQRGELDAFNQVDKIFHLLDGQKYDNSQYQEPLAAGLETGRNGETAYFKFIRYQNGNVHITFKRADLLKKFNQYGAGNQFILGGD